jgi:hypothetical protein
MIDRTFIADWRHLVIPITLSIAMVGGALAYAFS